MKTQLLTAEDFKNPHIQEDLKNLLNQGGLVVFPTETVYGIGGNACLEKAAQAIYAAKGRPSDNPLIVHLARFDQIDRYAYIDQPAVYALANAFWPGPMTLILRKKESIPDSVTGGLRTVAIRIPSHEVAHSLLASTDLPIAAPSANLSGKPSSTTFAHVLADFDGKVDAIVDGGNVPIGLESTVIDVTGAIPLILRPGAITQDMIEAILDKSVLDQSETMVNGTPKSPGMKYRHYAPKATLKVVKGKHENVVRFLKDATRNDLALIVLGPSEIIQELEGNKHLDLGTDKEAIAQHLFAALRKLDEMEIQRAYIVAIEESGVGKAIMNRVLKAANHEEIDTDQLLKQD